MDHNLPDKNSIALIKDLQTGAPQLLMLLLAMLADARGRGRALRAGTAGSILTSEDARTLPAAIHHELAGENLGVRGIAAPAELFSYAAFWIATGEAPAGA